MFDEIKCDSIVSEGFKRLGIRLIAALTALTVGIVALIGFSVNTVAVFDGEHTYTVRSLSTNPVSALSCVNLKSGHFKILNTKVSNRFTSIEIAYSFPVYITVGNNTTEVEFTGGTVLDALKCAGFNPNEGDFTEPSLDTPINSTVYIDYTDIEYERGSYTEPIAYTLETVYSAEKAAGTESVVAGTDGERLVSYERKLVNGTVSSQSVTAEVVVREAVNGKKIIGTGSVKKGTAVDKSAYKGVSTLEMPATLEFDENGVPLNYKSKITSRATAYTYTGSNCATGVAPKPGYIAVNPKVIPYGTKMYIRAADGSFVYGYAVAADTGGFVKNHPTGVDLFMSTRSACVSFGVRNMEIYILE